ncbi:unnamed protein product (macronuclear) [Paramecium tetraurelia]|uniref:4a-hydroxytetrahydrobiopterin dehydratase n=1 Tax=Paramecium tetraurelia TaxID=5888 RepID=A0BLH8_PARTE|nr:uncharacterized protein GSPATT00030028001 [Paramecium tetraurelia]CAK59395.1 unnamed protein product [Paramecium tetraurelia]|eukprot:XP_001426793.1 hypothetical protein (macronuclear) [Paramecium tetraurelia strain d4-2]
MFHQFKQLKLNSEEIASALEIHSLQWHPTKDTTKIKKEFKFNSFKETFAFTESISAVAEDMHHILFILNIYQIIQNGSKRKMQSMWR